MRGLKVSTDPALNAVLLAYVGKRILITGASGYLGSSMVDALKDIDCDICTLSRKTPERLTNNPVARFKSFTGDIRDPEIWKDALDGVDIVFHLAAQTSVYYAHDNPLEDLSVNVTPMIRLLETCEKEGYKPNILFAGTVTQMGIAGSLPVDESCDDLPVTHYDLHKLMAENYLKLYARNGLVKGATLRLSNVYGPGPKSSREDRGILNLMVKKALNGEDLTVYGAGDQIRDYAYIDDVATAFFMAGAKIDQVNGNHYVIGTGRGCSIREAFEMVATKAGRVAGKTVEVRSVDAPNKMSPIESRNFIANSGKLKDAVGWDSRVSLEEGIDRTIDYFHSDEAV